MRVGREHGDGAVIAVTVAGAGACAKSDPASHAITVTGAIARANTVADSIADTLTHADTYTDALTVADSFADTQPWLCVLGHRD